jgi:hypothetical protein
VDVLGSTASAPYYIPYFTLPPPYRHMQSWRAVAQWSSLPAGVDRGFGFDVQVLRHHLERNPPRAAVAAGAPARGIVVPAGGPALIANAFANLYVLRHHLGCTLPVTITYWGSHEPLASATVELFRAHLPDVTFLDLESMPYPPQHRPLVNPGLSIRPAFNGFKIKAFALYAAPYSEVLLLDSDAMPLVDPNALFESPEYRRAGNLFWPDRWCRRVPLFSLLGDDDGGGARPQADSGQLFFDRTRLADVMEWILFLNSRDEVTYRYAHGDKDTFRAAFYLAGRGDDYAQVEQPVSLALERGGFLGHTSRGFVHHHPNGSFAFVHRTSDAKYAANDAADRSFSHLLLQPSCKWSERQWHFFSPMVSNARRKSGADKGSGVAAECQRVSLRPGPPEGRCLPAGGAAEPLMLNVPLDSYVALAQAAADTAHALYHKHAATHPKPRRNRRLPSVLTLVIGATVAAVAAAMLTICAGVWLPSRKISGVSPRAEIQIHGRDFSL